VFTDSIGQSVSQSTEQWAAQNKFEVAKKINAAITLITRSIFNIAPPFLISAITVQNKALTTKIDVNILNGKM
jgi:hypothetical protein